VIECFWKLEPAICAVLRGVYAQRVFVVPLFISEGYFTEEVIPRELGLPRKASGKFERTMHRGDSRVTYCGPVGTHPGMTAVLLARAEQIVAKNPFPVAPKPHETALFIAGHGTGNNENSRKAIERQVELIEAMDIYAEVYPVFMEEEPKIADCYAMARSKSLVVVPFFISDGLHSYEDIPMMLGEPEKVVRERLAEGQPTWRNPTERRGKRLWYASSIGSEPLLANVIVDRVREAAVASEE